MDPIAPILFRDVDSSRRLGDLAIWRLLSIFLLTFSSPLLPFTSSLPWQHTHDAKKMCRDGARDAH